MKSFHAPFFRGTGSRWSIGGAVRGAACAIFLAVCSPFAAQAQVPMLLFKSGFEPNTTALGAPRDCWGPQFGGCWQDITGTDGTPTGNWGNVVWGAPAILQLLADASVTVTTVRDYMFNQLLTVTGHNGTPTQVLYSQVTQSGCCGGDPQSGATQNGFQIQPNTEGGDLYIRYWLKYQPDLDRQLASPSWRYLFSWKTGTPGFDDGDYRTVVQVVSWCVGSNPCWEIIGDDAARNDPCFPGCRVVFWDEYNTTVPVPVGQWFKFEVFWHRSTGPDGRVWMAVNGQQIVNHLGPNKIAKNINRIFLSDVYSGTAYPLYQWMDDLEIWNGFPPDASPH